MGAYKDLFESFESKCYNETKCDSKRSNVMRYPEAESNTLELKREWPRNNQIIKTIIGFCNTYGGKLVIGVNDDRSIVGISDSEIEEAMEVIDQSIFDACSPHIIPRLYIQHFGERAVLVVEVAEGMNKPYYQRSDGLEKGTYIRLGRHTMRATADMIQELKWQSSGIDFEVLPVYQATMQDLDEDAINEFLANRKNQGTIVLDERVLKSYNILTYDQTKKFPSVLGLLLFCRDPQLYFSEAMIICSHFRGIEGRDTIATVDCNGSLFNQFKQAFAFITERLYRSFTIKKLKREEQLEIPEEAIREALLNAIVHRNYHIKAPTKIAIYDDRVEFFSPGQFPGPIRIDNLQAGITYLRNPAICKILRESSYIEKIGSGFITIFSSYAKRGLKSPQIIEGENYIKCILPRTIEDTTITKTILDTDRILKLFEVRPEISVKDVVQALSISKATAIRRMNELMKDGLVVRQGQTKGIRYRLLKKKNS